VRLIAKTFRYAVFYYNIFFALWITLVVNHTCLNELVLDDERFRITACLIVVFIILNVIRYFLM